VRAAECMRELVNWAAGVTAASVPDAVLRHAALVLADDIAATVAAESELEVAAAQARLTERSSGRQRVKPRLKTLYGRWPRRPSRAPWSRN